MAEQEPKKVTVCIGEEFQAFSFQPRKLYLDLGLTPKALVPVWIKTLTGLDGKWDLGDSLFPFEPEKGYRITNEDFDSKKRQEKLEGLRGVMVDMRGYEWLTGATDQVALEELGLTTELRTLQPRISMVLKKLVLQLFFPNGLAFEAREREGGEGFWGGFYPLDTGKLPGHDGDLCLYLPKDIDLQTKYQIRARFFPLRNFSRFDF